MSLLKANDFWRPRQQYHASDRIKTLILHDDKFYVCNENHTSGDVFDVTKFTLVAGSGGGGLIPSGDWDIANSTTIGTIIDIPVELSVAYDATINNNVVTNNGFGIYPLGSGFNGYGADHSTFLKNDFSTTKWLTIANSAMSYQFFVIYKDDNINPITDILQKLFLSDTNINATFISGLIGTVGTPQILLTYNTSLGNFVPLSQINATSNNDISFGINLSTGNLTVDNITNLTNFTIPTSIFDGATNLKLFVGGIIGGPINANSISLLFPDQVNKPPILMVEQTFDIVPPVGAVDGSMWKITSNGLYDNTQLGINDYVIFYNNLLSIVPISNDTGELDVLNTSINNIELFLTEQLDGLLTLQERAIIRGVIDWVADEPEFPTLGDTFLTNSSPPGILSSNFLYVYDGSQWIELNQSPGSVFNVSSMNLKIKYVSGQGILEHRYVKRLIGTNSGFNPIIDLLFDSSNTSWFITDNVRSSGYLTTNGDGDNLYCILNDYSDYMIDLTVAFTSYNINLINSDIDVLFSIEPSTLYFRNSTNTDITIVLAASHPIEVIGKFISNRITIQANSNLVINARTIVKDEITPNYYTLIEYVAGNYISNIALNIPSSGTGVTINDNITDFYLEVDSADAFGITLNVDTLSNGQTFYMYYAVSNTNNSITFNLVHGANTYSTTLTVANNNKHNTIRFNGSSLGVY